ncbi:hypothetical protein J7432_06560 [Xanthomonas axonopodis pv. begoniae]|uniref:hypothetical protein n=1 Tax=Xanthomonas phaseoli TaxID=1985254 RepID=UPI000CEF3BEA|nr:hypothetical protein [Xanthomonas phaseoli]MBO9738697.1 hypothetical protein [Xanthomonas axonopodis pv. begoniae]MBO9770304.1 hypothetical protein [Xanthomonas axonopodis pv. begoniae]MCC8468433.1 hypothetical protein [Xanthomonas phaseoli]PPT38054.1 hypothetical protein XabCFBP2524_07065 [Xanthomonas axonopodis pv. begoniae]
MIDKRCTRWLLISASAGGCIAASAALLLLAWHLTMTYCWQSPGLTDSQDRLQLPPSSACIARWRLATDQTAIALSMLIALATCSRLLHHLLRRRPPDAAA